MTTDNKVIKETSETTPAPQYASFNARMFACIIDSVVSLIPLAILADIGQKMIGEVPVHLTQKAALRTITPEELAELNQYLWLALTNLSIQLVVVCIIVVVFWIYKGGTPGKMWLGIKIIDDRTGNPPSVAQSLIRFLGYIPSTIVGFLGFFWIAFSKERRGWHDMMAGTIVVYTEHSVYQRVAKRYAGLLSGRRD